MKKKNILNNLDSIVAGSVFIFMLLFTVASVFMRYIVGQPFIVTEEIQLWCMVWLVFFGIVVVSRQGFGMKLEALDKFVDDAVMEADGIKPLHDVKEIGRASCRERV